MCANREVYHAERDRYMHSHNNSLYSTEQPVREASAVVIPHIDSIPSNVFAPSVSSEVQRTVTPYTEDAMVLVWRSGE